ncbi:MAG: hypothetical protein ACPGYV_15230 [Phycisphaeraceae bacterium]
MLDTNMTAKERARQIIEELPEDSSFDEVLKELALHRMIARGLDDLENGRSVMHDEMKKRVESWLK